MAARSSGRDNPSHVVLRVLGADDGDPDSRQVGEFLMLLRGVYVASQHVEDDGKALDVYLSQLNASELTALLSTKKPRVPLLMRRITHESPLEFLFFGLAYAILAAIVRSDRGGKLSVRGSVKTPGGVEMTGEITAELPGSLSEANKELRTKLSQGSGASLTFGAAPRTVILTKTQLAELMKQDPSRAKKGTFQRRLVGWQSRVHKSTRKLTLYAEDIDFILRHGSNKGGGGWQGRIRKIFGAHFDWP